MNRLEFLLDTNFVLGMMKSDPSVSHVREAINPSVGSLPGVWEIPPSSLEIPLVLPEVHCFALNNCFGYCLTPAFRFAGVATRYCPAHRNHRCLNTLTR